MSSKPIPKSVLIFGAANHIGKPMAKFLQKEAPKIKLRLVSSNEQRAEGLRKAFPDAEVVVADYLDLPSLEKAVDGIEGFYVSGPPYLDPNETMNNFVAAVKKSGTAIDTTELEKALRLLEATKNKSTEPGGDARR